MMGNLTLMDRVNTAPSPSQAYEVLSDEEKRGRFDRGEDVEQPQGHPGQQQGHPFFHQGGQQFHFQWG